MASLRPGGQLGHYRIEELVARSGMASIYRAIDMRPGRPVAVKIPHPDMEADPVLLTVSTARSKSANDWIIPG